MTNLVLFFSTVVIWGTTWIAIKFQVGEVAPEVSIAYRFLGAAAFMFLYCAAFRWPLRFPPRAHLFFGLQGLCLFCLNYVAIYWASTWLTSGLVAVGFSTVVVFSTILNAIAAQKTIEIRVALGALTGIAGLSFIFLPELRSVDLTDMTIGAMALTILGAFMASLGTVLGGRNQKAGLPVLQSNAFGMLYGGLAITAYVTLSPLAWSWDASLGYGLSLGYLILFGSVIGFWTFLTVARRLGPERASYVTVLFPVVALGISSFVEGYAWSGEAMLGVLLVIGGNVLMLRKPPAASGTPTQANPASSACAAARPRNLRAARRIA